MTGKTGAVGISRRTVVIFCGFVVLVALIVWPAFLGRIRYAQTRAELQAIRDAAMVAELSSVSRMGAWPSSSSTFSITVMKKPLVF